MSMPDGRQQILLSAIKRRKLSWSGQVRRYIIRSWKLYGMVQGAVYEIGVSFGETTLRSGHASQCRRCCNRQATITTEESVGVSNDARA